MSMPEFKKQNEWLLKTDTFGIMIRAWKLSDDWVWNMYVLIYDNHPLFSDAEAVCDLDFHGGCTFEEKITHAPARGIRYDWQKERSYLKVGCDYHHYWDDHFMRCDPADGIPGTIQADAQRLFEELKARGET